MERLTNDKTAAELKENIDKLTAVGIEVDPENLRYVRLAELERKEIPIPVELEGDGYDDNGEIDYDTAYCPCCRKDFEFYYDEHSDFCPSCGQALDWGDEFESVDLKPGDAFTYNGIKFIALDINGDTLFAVTAKIMKMMPFSDSGSNDYRESNVKKWIEDEFLNIICTDNLCAMHIDLTADNGDDDYGGLHAMAAPLSCDQYRKYKKLMPKYDDWVWTVTPWTCDPSNASNVRSIHPSGALYYISAGGALGVAPACMFNLDNLKSRREAQSITIIRKVG